MFNFKKKANIDQENDRAWNLLEKSMVGFPINIQDLLWSKIEPFSENSKLIETISLHINDFKKKWASQRPDLNFNSQEFDSYFRQSFLTKIDLFLNASRMSGEDATQAHVDGLSNNDLFSSFIKGIFGENGDIDESRVSNIPEEIKSNLPQFFKWVSDNVKDPRISQKIINAVQQKTTEDSEVVPDQNDDLPKEQGNDEYRIFKEKYKDLPVMFPKQGLKREKQQIVRSTSPQSIALMNQIGDLEAVKESFPRSLKGLDNSSIQDALTEAFSHTLEKAKSNKHGDFVVDYKDSRIRFFIVFKEHLNNVLEIIKTAEGVDLKQELLNSKVLLTDPTPEQIAEGYKSIDVSLEGYNLLEKYGTYLFKYLDGLISQGINNKDIMSWVGMNAKKIMARNLGEAANSQGITFEDKATGKSQERAGLSSAKDKSGEFDDATKELTSKMVKEYYLDVLGDMEKMMEQIKNIYSSDSKNSVKVDYMTARINILKNYINNVISANNQIIKAKLEKDGIIEYQHDGKKFKFDLERIQKDFAKVVSDKEVREEVKKIGEQKLAIRNQIEEKKNEVMLNPEFQSKRSNDIRAYIFNTFFKGNEKIFNEVWPVDGDIESEDIIKNYYLNPGERVEEIKQDFEELKKVKLDVINSIVASSNSQAPIVDFSPYIKAIQSGDEKLIKDAREKIASRVFESEIKKRRGGGVHRQGVVLNKNLYEAKDILKDNYIFDIWDSSGKIDLSRVEDVKNKIGSETAEAEIGKLKQRYNYAVKSAVGYDFLNWGDKPEFRESTQNLIRNNIEQNKSQPFLPLSILMQMLGVNSRFTGVNKDGSAENVDPKYFRHIKNYYDLFKLDHNGNVIRGKTAPQEVVNKLKERNIALAKLLNHYIVKTSNKIEKVANIYNSNKKFATINVDTLLSRVVDDFFNIFK